MDVVVLTFLLDEIEREEEHELSLQRREIQRSLRDNSDPFSVPDRHFKAPFRFPKHIAQELIERLHPYMQAPVRSTAIPIYLKVLAALHFYGKGSYQSCIGQNYSLCMSQCAISRALHEVTTTINNYLARECIRFPQRDEEIKEIKESFMEKFNFPGIVGVLDGTLITIVPPPVEHEVHPAHLFIDRKGRHSLNTLIICDANLKILSLNARYPGSVHDAAVWAMSSINDHLEERYLRTRESSWLIGDSGYPNQPWLLTPVLQAQPGSPEERYNNSLCRARNCVERCIGVLKGRFRCLLKDRVLHYAPPMAGSIINACAALHNFLVNRNVPWDDPVFEEEENENAADDIQDVLLEGRNVRARIIRSILPSAIVVTTNGGLTPCVQFCRIYVII